jgi:hypothetical protein
MLAASRITTDRQPSQPRWRPPKFYKEFPPSFTEDYTRSRFASESTVSKRTPLHLTFGTVQPSKLVKSSVRSCCGNCSKSARVSSRRRSTSPSIRSRQDSGSRLYVDLWTCNFSRTFSCFSVCSSANKAFIVIQEDAKRLGAQ